MNVLGIDAAWTIDQPSGVSLITSDDGVKCKLIRVSDSYNNFLHKTKSLTSKPYGSKPNLNNLLEGVELEGISIDCIAIDMPLSNELISGRRSCDNEVSKVYGSKGASTHSPNINRPGMISLDFVKSANELGYYLSTQNN